MPAERLSASAHGPSPASPGGRSSRWNGGASAGEAPSPSTPIQAEDPAVRADQRAGDPAADAVDSPASRSLPSGSLRLQPLGEPAQVDQRALVHAVADLLRLVVRCDPENDASSFDAGDDRVGRHALA